MDRTLFSSTDFAIPTGSVPVFAVLNPLLLVPLYESPAVALLRRLTSLQRISAGLFVSVVALAAIAAVESNLRRHSAAPPAFF